MSTFLINLISVGGALLILGGYWFFFVYWFRGKENRESADWSKRLGKTFSAPEEEAAALTLLKDNPDTDIYFKSKLPKIEGLKEWIQHAGLEIKPSIFIAASLIVGLITAFIFLFVFRANFLFSVLIGVVSSFLLPWAFIAFFTIRKKNKFLAEFPIALDMIRRALRAGHSADRALDMVAEQMTGSIGEIFRTITDKMRLGESTEAVLAEMSNRLGVDDFRMLSIVMVLQRETGGSLAEATENFAKIIRAREFLRKKVKALSAEVRVTAMILIAIPFFILGSVYFTTPTYLDPLFNTEQGHRLLLIGGLMLTTGIGIIIRMVYKEIY